MTERNDVIMIPEKPLMNSYWVVPGRFLAGEYPRNRDHAFSRAKLKALLDAGVTAFVDLSEAGSHSNPITNCSTT